MHAKPELAHRLQTSKMRHNLTSLNTCQHDVDIVTVCVARRRCTAPLKPRRPCVKYFICNGQKKRFFLTCGAAVKLHLIVLRQTAEKPPERNSAPGRGGRLAPRPPTEAFAPLDPLPPFGNVKFVTIKM